MEKADIERLRNLPIEAVAQRLGMEVTCGHKTICPFHQDSHPSLSFRQLTNRYRCFVCDATGDTISLAMHVLGKPFAQTCQWLANEHNVLLHQGQPAVKPHKVYPPDIAFLQSLMQRPVLNAKAQHFLFNERHIDPRVVHWLGISSINVPTPCWRYGKAYYDAPSLLFPYRTVEGQLQNVQSRYLGNESGVPRFRFPQGSHCRLFGLPILKRLMPGEPLYLAEGITDCMALLSAGHKAVGIPSATLLNKADVELLVSHGAKNLHIYPDADEAGNRLYVNLLQVATQAGACLVRHILPEGCKDFADYWKQYNN